MELVQECYISVSTSTALYFCKVYLMNEQVIVFPHMEGFRQLKWRPALRRSGSAQWRALRLLVSGETLPSAGLKASLTCSSARLTGEDRNVPQ